MKNKLKKSVLISAAAALTAASFSSLSCPVSAVEEDSDIILSAEVESFDGVETWTSIYADEIPGYSGDGFVYLANGNSVKFEVDVPEDGMYDISFRCAQFLNAEGREQYIQVNGIEYKYSLGYMRDWTDVSFGIFRLKEGKNTIYMDAGKYGYASYDTVTISKVKHEALKGTAETCDPDATSETKSLLAYLNSIYGKHILSGQQEIWGGGHSRTTTIRYDKDKDQCIDSDGVIYRFDEKDKDVADDGSTFVWTCYGEDGQAYSYNQQNRNYTYSEYDYEIKYIKNLTGETPAIRGFDYGNTCPCYAWDDGVTDRIIDWAKKNNGIATASWHINVPTRMADYTLGEPLDFSKTTYSEKTDFVASNVLVEGTTENEYFKLCMDNLAKELLKLQDAGVPLLWRPFHEAEGRGGVNGEGSWFWWSKEGAEVDKAIWKYLYETLTKEYGIHNLIWIENLYAWSDASAEWYVGDDYVDIVGFDKYDTEYNRHDGKTSGPNEDCNSSVFWSLVKYVKNAKMVAMPENSTIPALNNIKVESANWLYFCTWYDDEQNSNFISGTDYQDPERVKEMYQSDYCITLDELPENLYSFKSEDTSKPTDPTDDTTNSTDIKEDIVYGDADQSGKLEISDAAKIMSYVANSETYPMSDEALDICDVYQRGDGVNNMDALSVRKKLAQLIPELPESYNK